VAELVNLVTASAASLSARDKVVQEIYNTEHTYVHQLELLIEVCPDIRAYQRQRLVVVS
jgi:hypothetical protein